MFCRYSLEDDYYAFSSGGDIRRGEMKRNIHTGGGAG
jgi:hypothetical protein